MRVYVNPLFNAFEKVPVMDLYFSKATQVQPTYDDKEESST